MPDDLVVLDQKPVELSAAELAKIDRIDWYQPDRDLHPRYGSLLLVSYKQLAKCIDGGFDGTDPVDCGLDLKGVELIESVLHRWEDGGFYHA